MQGAAVRWRLYSKTVTDAVQKDNFDTNSYVSLVPHQNKVIYFYEDTTDMINHDMVLFYSFVVDHFLGNGGKLPRDTLGDGFPV